MAEMIVTIDGPAGVGKSTVSRMLAKILGAAFLDTGAMYRALTLAALGRNVDLTDTQKVLEVLEGCEFEFTVADDEMRVAVDGRDVTAAIRAPEVTAAVRHVAAAGLLRGRLVEMQRRFAARYDRIVTEGRDQGTVAFPDAGFKFFLAADVDERAQRRKLQLEQAGACADIRQLKADIIKRDASDENRLAGPLIPAEDAVIIDTTHLDAAGVVKEMVEIIKRKTNGADSG
ncbi:MAG: (d)CMP kinase [Planctomycetota bacterium]|nr:MAG: (d)CMP kinase [Planctomycetota bacterium]